MKKFLLIAAVVVIGFIVYAKLNGSGGSTNQNQTRPPEAAASPTPAMAAAAERPASDDPLLDMLLALKEKTGRDNALIYYCQAAAMTKGKFPDFKESELIKLTLDKGWTNKSQPLQAMLGQYQPALDQARKGVAIDAAEYYVADNPEEDRVPNFLSGQTLTKVFCVEGRLLESQGQPARALDDYLAALAMGRDYGAKGAPLIGGLISVACQKIALDQLARLAGAGTLDRGALERASERINAIESGQPGFAEWVRSEQRRAAQQFAQIRKDPQKFTDEMNKLQDPNKIPADEYLRNLDRIEAETKQNYEWWAERVQLPYAQRAVDGGDRALSAKLTASMHPAAARHFPNFIESNLRWMTMRTRFTQARIAVAAALYKMDKGALPQNLEALIPVYLDSALQDCFSGQPMLFQLDPQGRRWIWSIGPDLKNQACNLVYDPSNGIASTGDIFIAPQ